jgi:hypothetical protein
MEIEVIGSVRAARMIAERFPFLSVRSVLEIPEVGRSMIAELLGRDADYATLGEEESGQVESKLPKNGFQYWLIHKASQVSVDFGASTESGVFERFVDERAGG